MSQESRLWDDITVLGPEQTFARHAKAIAWVGSRKSGVPAFAGRWQSEDGYEGNHVTFSPHFDLVGAARDLVERDLKTGRGQISPRLTFSIQPANTEPKMHKGSIGNRVGEEVLSKMDPQRPTFVQSTGGVCIIVEPITGPVEPKVVEASTKALVGKLRALDRLQQRRARNGANNEARPS